MAGDSGAVRGDDAVMSLAGVCVLAMHSGAGLSRVDRGRAPVGSSRTEVSSQ